MLIKTNININSTWHSPSGPRIGSPVFESARIIEIGYTDGMIRDTNPMAPTLLSIFTVGIKHIFYMITTFKVKHQPHTDISIALSCPIELSHIGNLKAFHELRPNLRPQTVAEHSAYLMLCVLGRWFCGQHIATHLPDVLGNLKRGTLNFKCIVN